MNELTRHAERMAIRDMTSMDASQSYSSWRLPVPCSLSRLDEFGRTDRCRDVVMSTPCLCNNRRLSRLVDRDNGGHIP